MFMQRWSRTGKPIHHGRRGRTRLAIEALEGRILLSADMVLRWNDIMVSAVRTMGPGGRNGDSVNCSDEFFRNNSRCPRFLPFPPAPWRRSGEKLG